MLDRHPPTWHWVEGSDVAPWSGVDSARCCGCESKHQSSVFWLVSKNLKQSAWFFYT